MSFAIIYALTLGTISTLSIVITSCVICHAFINDDEDEKQIPDSVKHMYI